MASADILVDAFGRIRGQVHRVVKGLTPQQLSERIDGRSNSVAWLIWHLTRIQDDHLADAADLEQIWTADGWSERFHLPFDDSETGYGHSSAQVSAVKVSSGELLIGYYDAVHEQTIGYLKGLKDSDLPRIVDESFDPPVALGTRLVSVISDDLQHVGQAALVRGLFAN
ncbi:MAG: hypothetical protein JWN96_2780 [Mycobacterium sp.]|nr:hypothetical protein [Mycobacterium sp.]